MRLVGGILTDADSARRKAFTTSAACDCHETPGRTEILRLSLIGQDRPSGDYRAIPVSSP